VFNLFAVEGYSHHEIAQELGITESTSRSQLTHARRFLRNLLEAQQQNLAYE
jgi:RNA polymerase sigma-70 factor, ECF subfamily